MLVNIQTTKKDAVIVSEFCLAPAFATLEQLWSLFREHSCNEIVITQSPAVETSI